MAEKLRGIPFDANEIILPDGSAGYDNVLYSADFAEWMQTYFKNGILVPGGALISTELRTTKLDDTHVQIDVGNAVINGRTTFVKTPISLSINKAGPDLERRDRIVIELNLAAAVNSFRILILSGTMAAIPNIPTLTRNDEIYQISLATVSVNQSGIYDIVDDRPDENVCGISQVLIGVRNPLPVTGDEASNIGYDNSVSLLEGTTVQTAIDEVASILNNISKDIKITLNKDGWTNNSQTVTIDGFTENMKTPFVDVIADSVLEDRQWGKIWKVSTVENGLTFFCSDNIPSIDLNVIVKVVR